MGKKKRFLFSLQGVIIASKATGGMIAQDLRGGHQLNKNPQGCQGAPEQLEQITGMKSLSQFAQRAREKK